MAKLARNSAFILTLNILLALGLGWALSAYLSRSQSQAQTTPTEPAGPTDAITYGHVRLLQEQLALRNQDLAAMGCSQSQAGQILAALKQWCSTNNNSLKSAHRSEMAARSSLQQAMMKVNMGPRDEALLASFGQLEQSLASAQAQRQQLFAAAASAVSSSLGSAQQQVWNTSRANRNVPNRWRYVPNLTTEQQQSLDTQLRLARGDETAVRAAENLFLDAVQRQAMAIARQNVGYFLPQVLAARAAVLPPPQTQEQE